MYRSAREDFAVTGHYWCATGSRLHTTLSTPLPSNVLSECLAISLIKLHNRISILFLITRIILFILQKYYLSNNIYLMLDGLASSPDTKWEGEILLIVGASYFIGVINDLLKQRIHVMLKHISINRFLIRKNIGF